MPPSLWRGQVVLWVSEVNKMFLGFQDNKMRTQAPLAPIHSPLPLSLSCKGKKTKGEKRKKRKSSHKRIPAYPTPSNDLLLLSAFIIQEIGAETRQLVGALSEIARQSASSPPPIETACSWVSDQETEDTQ